MRICCDSKERIPLGSIKFIKNISHVIYKFLILSMDQKKITEFKKWFEQFSGALVAFSGGIDSALVLFLSRKYLGKRNAIGVIANSESLKSSDYQLALDFAQKNDIILETVYTSELSDHNYNTNPSNRCYFCKTHLYTTMETTKKKFPTFTVMNGTNKDDFSDYRPGLKAAEENRVRSPLAELDISKKEVRELAKYFGIPFWDKPASPCLSSRIPYGSEVTKLKLQQIEKAEAILNEAGFSDVRVRHYGLMCKVEVPMNQLQKLSECLSELEPKIKALGFSECQIDNEGLISGKLNRLIKV